MTASTTQLALKAASAAVIGFGVVVAMAAAPATDGITAFFADLLFWPLDGAPGLQSPTARLLAAIGGGVMVGWGLMLWLVATRVLPIDPSLGAAMIRTSVIAWFVVDSAGSVIAGAPLNALPNGVFLAAFLLPLRRRQAHSVG